MVQIIPPKTNIGTQIGQSLGQGLQSGFQQGFQRGLLQDALKKIEGLGNRPEGQEVTPFELASTLMSATAGLPGAERYVGQLFPLLLQQLQNQKFGSIPPPGGGLPSPPSGVSPQQAVGQQPTGQQQAPVPTETGAPPQQQRPLTQAQLDQARESLPLPISPPTLDLFGNAPEDLRYGSGPRPVTYSQEDYSKVERDYRGAGLDPAPAINFMQRQDEIARNRYNDILKGVDVEYNLQEKRESAQERVRNTLQNQLGIKEPRLLAVADFLARRPQFAKIPSEFRRAEAIRAELNKYAATESAFNVAASRPNPVLFPARYKTQKQTLKNDAQRMIDYGQRDQVYSTLAKNGWSETEIAKILNPLSEPVKKKVDTIPHYAIARTEAGAGRRIGTDQKILDKANDKIKQILVESIKPGIPDPNNPDVLKPGTSLILLKDAFRRKGVDADSFDRILTQLVENRQIELDPEQNRELNIMKGEPFRVKSIFELVTEGFGGG